MTKAELIEEVAGKVKGFTKRQTEIIINGILDGIKETLARGDKIEIRGFGSFRTRERRGRTGRNPKTGAKVEVPPKKIPFFKPSKELKDFVNGDASAAAKGSPGAASRAPATSNAPRTSAGTSPEGSLREAGS